MRKKLLLGMAFVALVALVARDYWEPRRHVGASTGTLFGTIVGPDGSPLNGHVTFLISNSGTDTTSNLAVVAIPITYPIVNGALPQQAALTRNDQIQPLGTYYQANFYDAANNLVNQANYVIAAPTNNIGQMIATTITTSNISYAQPCSPTSSCSPLNGITYVPGAPTAAAFLSAVNAGCNGTIPGQIYVPPVTINLAGTFFPPSNCAFHWNNTTLNQAAFSGDLVCLGPTNGGANSCNFSGGAGPVNVSFLGKLYLTQANAGLLAVGATIDIVDATNFTWDDIESTKGVNSCMEGFGATQIRGSKLLCTNTGQIGTSAFFFFGNNNTTPSGNIQVDTLDFEGNSGSTSDCFYISGTAATPTKQVNINKIIANGCSDEALELNFTQANVGEIIVGTFTNITGHAAVAFRRTTDDHIGEVYCNSNTIAVCVDIATYANTDGPTANVTINQIIAHNAIGTNTANVGAVRITSAGGTGLVSNVVIGNVIVDTSTRGLLCIASAVNQVQHITINNLISHNNNGDGVLLDVCNDVLINNLISFDNGQNLTGLSLGDHGDGVELYGGTVDVMINNARVFDDQGSKTQKYGINANIASVQRLHVWDCDCNNANEVTAGFNDAGTNDTFGPLITSSNGAEVINGSLTLLSLNDFATSFGKMFSAVNGTTCTNGELALSAGWQSTGSATVTGVKGAGAQACEWTITTGTTTAANPTVTDTLTQALGSASTVCHMIITGGNRTAAASDSFDQTTQSATAPVFTFQGTPTAGGKTYQVVRVCGP